MQSVLIVNFLLNIGSFIGIILWAVQQDIYTLTSMYEFYWCVSVMSLLVSVLGLLFHKYNLLRDPISKSGYGIYFMTFLSFILCLFWFSAAVSITRLTKDCLYVKNKYNSIIDYYFDSNFTCNGEIISMSFGYVLFMFWGIILINSIKKMLLQINSEKTDQETNTDNIIEMTIAPVTESNLDEIKTRQN